MNWMIVWNLRFNQTSLFDTFFRVWIDFVWETHKFFLNKQLTHKSFLITLSCVQKMIWSCMRKCLILKFLVQLFNQTQARDSLVIHMYYCSHPLSTLSFTNFCLFARKKSFWAIFSYFNLKWFHENQLNG